MLHMSQITNYTGELFIDDSGFSKCAWFAGCTNYAESTEYHLILGDVPICGRCLELCGTPAKGTL